MSALRSNGIPFELNGVTYFLKYDLNILDQIQDRYPDMDEYFKSLGKFKEIRCTMTALINNDIDRMNEEDGAQLPMLTEKEVGRHISASRCKEVQKCIKDALQFSSPVVDEESIQKNGISQ